MQAKEIRSKFISFFEDKGHTFVPSAPMVLKNDPTLMFTNAGMNQFKDFFLGNQKANYTRAVNSQKCLRVSGKHNDLEEVGIDTYHHTMFEMLGNWSFGDFFKKEAIAWAWELLTKVYGLPKERMYVTVFEGDEKDGVPFDQEAFDFWKEWIDPSRILNGDKKDNFWEMGESGPCGPCSEIHIDLRPEEEIKKVPGKELVNHDHPQVVEIWNLVFIQFNRRADKSLTELPAKHIDTGMGFERLVMALQNKTSNYDTDVFTPLIAKMEALAGVQYGQEEQKDIAIRVIVDHIRAISFAIADGQLPSNNKAGYVIRRILRRAVRYGYTFLALKRPFLFELVAVLSEQYKGFFDELPSQQELIEKVIKEEEAAFLRTLENGLKKLEQVKEQMAKSGEKTISGQTVFELYDTFGFPEDLTALIARENSLNIDEKGFFEAMEKQKQRSKADAQSEKGDWVILLPEESSQFVGYDHTEVSCQIIKYRAIKEKKKEVYQVVLSKTPFYGESGGQVGDTGLLENDEERIKVLDTQKENDLIVHFVNQTPKQPQADFTAKINVNRREAIKYNHSATHLLHAVLRDVLGEHVQQKGSLVSDQVLRFDFSHFSKVGSDELRAIEQRVNDRIRDNIQLLEKRNVPIAKAKEMGAMALFGEKYGDEVRVITFNPDFSVELCGGTHVTATGQIGMFKIISESAVASGVRRIEAFTGNKALAYWQEQESTLKEVKELLRQPKDIQKALQQLMDQQKQLTKEIEALHQKQSQSVKQSLKSAISTQGEMNILIQKVNLPSADALKKLSFELKNEISNAIVVLAADVSGSPQIAVVIDESLVKAKGIDAGQWVRELAKHIKGGGGGQPFFATAGGKDINGLDKVVEEAKRLIEALK